MGPQQLAQAAAETAKRHGAKFTQIVGDDLLAKNYPAIHRVGRASALNPRLIDFTWGEAKHPKVTLIGKGVTFDTGGLDIKSSSGMYLMKKDMGGAACVLAIAAMVMDAELPVRLRVLIPAVENAIAGNAFRPSDVITMRNGLTVEVGNTDAEGRLILADALAEASDEKPDLMIDLATLTGAARGALGTDLPALFCNDDTVADQLLTAGKPDCRSEQRVGQPLCRSHNCRLVPRKICRQRFALGAYRLNGMESIVAARPSRRGGSDDRARHLPHD